MMKELFNSYNIYETLLNMTLSLVAGLVRYLDDDKKSKNKGFFDKELFKALLFSVFCGFIAFVFMKSDFINVEFNSNTIALIVAASSFSSKTILKLLKSFITKYKPRI